MAESDDVRTEYTAICENLNHLANRRFTLVGFYVVAIGFIASGQSGIGGCVVLLWLTIAFWVLDLRTRSLHTEMAHRAVAIERETWGYSGERAYDGFVSSWSRVPYSDGQTRFDPPEPVAPKMFDRIEINLPFTHSLGLDMLFGGIGLYAIAGLIYLFGAVAWSSLRA